MNTDWFSIEISAPAAAIDLICAHLDELGCGGTVIEDRQLDTFVPPSPELDPDAVYLIKAYFAETAAREDMTGQISSALSELRTLNPAWEITIGAVAAVHQEDWAENWKQNFSVLRIGQHLVIKPTWENVQAGKEDRVIEIDPGMAFGTGTHGTTLLCLETIAELMAAEDPPRSLLDVGTGSGILALAAAVLGCQRVLACDIDEQACQVARANVAHNNLNTRIETTTTPLEELSGEFDLVIANILAEENVRLKQALTRRLAPGGYLILSGILTEKESFVRQHFSDPALQVFPTRYQDDWVCLMYRNRPL
ncbi:MAG: 50S ribosomal protein L11 methyltransferase [Desulfuromonadales bacterium]|nr:50S ribosomal protein L11 methyltransferase [Desulfuromonadales bacterium]